MIYLESFRLASESDEAGYLLSGRKPSNPYPKGHKLDMTCHNVNNPYPFKIFPFKYMERLDFSPITGPEGNIEFLADLWPGEGEVPSDEMIADVVARAHKAHKK